MEFFSPGKIRSTHKTHVLRHFVDVCHYIETSWEQKDVRDHGLAFLREAFTMLGDHADPEVRALSRLSGKLNRELDLKQFISVVTPFERTYARGRADHEILVHHEDKDSRQETLPLTVVAHNIRSAFNVGAIFRTSECLGVKEIVLTGYTATPDETKTHKTTMGTEAFVRWSWEASLMPTLAKLKSAGQTVVALETAANATPLTAFHFPNPCVLVLGNERFGLEPDVLAAADHVLSIPMLGRKNSLNVAIALGIAGFEVLRQWQAKDRH